MIVPAPSAQRAQQLAQACRVVLGIPYDPQQRGAGCPPPPAGRVLEYCRVAEVDGGPALIVDGDWSQCRGQTVQVGGGPVTIPDVAPQPRPGNGGPP